MSLRNYKTIEERRNYLKNKLQINLEATGIYPKNLDEAQFTNCENMIGAVQIPLGVAGPLKISGQFAKGDYYIPLATTEGALVASVNRGCKAIFQSGGARTMMENIGATRGPVFKTNGIVEGLKFKEWIEANIERLKSVAGKTSRHLTLLKIDVRIVGKNVFTRFYFDTQEAMGMNMATIATDEVVKFIQKETKIECLSLAGNFDTDKKSAWLNFISGRGKSVWAESVIEDSALKDVLKSSAKQIYDVWLSKCMIGSAISGSLGFNAHFANTVSALFLACGQDAAHAVEGSMGITTTEITGDNLYISVYLPDLMLGTVGGGTKLPSQKEALAILGINSEKNSSLELAEICAVAVLAGELSLLASLAQGTLATSHQKLARKNK